MSRRNKPREKSSSTRNNWLLPEFLPEKHILATCTLAIMLFFLSCVPSGDDARPGHRRSLPVKINLPEQETLPEPALGLSSPPASIYSAPSQPAPAATSSEPPLRTSIIEPTLAPPTSTVAASIPPPESATAASGSPPAAPALVAPAELPPNNGAPWQNITVSQGDSLFRLFQRVGLDEQVLYQVMSDKALAKDLSRLYPGEELRFQIANGELQSMRYVKSSLESLFIERDGDAFTSSKNLRTPEVRQRFSHATIDDSLFNAGSDADLPDNIIMELANIFSGVIDFVYDPRKGDTFSVLYEELYLDDKKLRAGKILAASFTNRGTEYPAFYYTDKKGKPGYYNAEGVSMRKAFLRSPVDFTRISSNFNPARLHPIFKTRRPHRGVDYAAPRGTPVFSTGDGRVTKAGYSKANGNYLVIGHGDAFITKYLHLHKKLVKRGQRVRQGQIIGKVGSTGYATGAHLHYEFLLHGVQRNPRTIHKKLPKAQSLSRAEIPSFKATVQPLQARLQDYNRTHLLASRDTDQPTIN